jgi:hypothetical protein
MSAKISRQRRTAFLRALSETGNQTIAAERAKVSRSWVCLHRSTDAAFDAACRAAIEDARRLLEALPANRVGSPHAPPDPTSPLPPIASRRVPPSPAKGGGARTWRYHEGVELVVRGTGGSGGGKRVQIGRARVKQWTPRAEARFLAVLAATCNVRAACAEVGMWPPSAYNHRKRWITFAEAWDRALLDGFSALEAALVEAGCNLFSKRGRAADEDETAGPELRIVAMTAEHALALLNLHKRMVCSEEPRSAQGVADMEAIRRRLDRKLEILRMSPE